MTEAEQQHLGSLEESNRIMERALRRACKIIVVLCRRNGGRIIVDDLDEAMAHNVGIATRRREQLRATEYWVYDDR